MSRPKRCHPWCVPGRHVFTHDECLRGYEQAQLAVNERFPDARCQHGAALSHCLLRVKHPQFFEVRRLKKRVARIEKRASRDNGALKSIKRELAALETRIISRERKARKQK